MNTTALDAAFPTEAEKTTMAGIWKSLTNRMRSHPAWMTLALTIPATAGIGWLDYITGFEVNWFIFYTGPIFITVWWAGGRSGRYVALLTGAVWWLANKSTSPHSTELGYAWSLINRLVSFYIVVVAVSASRNKQEANEAQIRMLEERRQLEKDIVSVSEHEQQRIGQDLHDGICQQLAAIGCAARVLSEDLQAQGVQSAQDASMIESSVQQVVLEARNLARGIFPVHVDRSGLTAALDDLGKMMGRLTGIPIVVSHCVDVSVDAPEVSMNLYRIAQEAVANAVKHSGATEIVIDLKQENGWLEMRVEDNGKGMTQTQGQRDEGMGLRTMHYRAQALLAKLAISRRPQGGTLVCCRLQLEKIKHLNDHEKK
ncbi:sensor histidine kinase [Prosthecobacter sp.]|uniref:sensor histidine kinase n=1 Tax=Prosthecobacter sp. TaxID=1965333 RepID=UPI003784A11C